LFVGLNFKNKKKNFSDEIKLKKKYLFKNPPPLPLPGGVRKKAEKAGVD